MPKPRIVPPSIVDELAFAYTNGGRIAEIGKPYGYDYKTVRRVLVAHGVAIRQKGGIRKPPIAHIDEVLALHQSGLSCRQIAIRYGTYPAKISNLLRDTGHEPEDGRNRRGSKNPITKSGRWISKDGYITVNLDPDEYHLKGSRGGNSMLEHRLIIARQLGRALFDYENVHHINGDRSDNRIENLELWDKGQPPGQRKGQGLMRKHCPSCTCC